MLHAACWKCRTQKLRKKSPSGHHRTSSGCIFATKACIDNRTENSNISSTCPHSMVNFGPPTAEICWRVYLLGWYTIYIYILRGCKIHFASKSCVLLYWLRYCTALNQRPSAKLCCVVQEMELWNFRRGCHLYLLGGHHVWHRPTF